jgi:hypothetical protein
MNVTTIAFNLAALAASFAALAISSILAFKQTRIMRASNQLPLLVEYFSELRSVDFNVQDTYLREHLPDIPAGARGFRGFARAGKVVRV